MPKTKSGEEITWKEFFKRWKKGIEQVSQYHQTKYQIRSTLIILIGIMAGLYASIINVETLWWLIIILTGAFFNTIIQLVGLWQKKKLLEPFYIQDKSKEVKNEQESTTD